MNNEYNSHQKKTHKKKYRFIQYLSVSWRPYKLWSAYCEGFEDNWPFQNGTTLGV